MKTQLTRQQAINLHCKNCGSDEQAVGCGSWVQQIEDCPIKHCELYPYRPLTESTRQKLLAEKIANMTPEELAKHEKKVKTVSERMKISRSK